MIWEQFIWLTCHPFDSKAQKEKGNAEEEKRDITKTPGVSAFQTSFEAGSQVSASEKTR
jgi:hypothetical protein